MLFFLSVENVQIGSNRVLGQKAKPRLAVADLGMKHAPGQKFDANVFSKKNTRNSRFFLCIITKITYFFQIQYGAREMAKN